MSDLKFQQCGKTVMDNIADPYITFDEKGICNYYYEYFELEKKHVKKELITLGYHGNPQHLNHFSLSLNRALDRIAKKYNIELIVFKSKISSMSDWVTEKPNIPIKYIDFDLKTFSSNMYNFDIGLVPNISEFTIGNQQECPTKGMYHSDFKIRFKNKSNIGRALVLIQHGIPVICDVTPSNMSIFHDPNNGHAVLSEDGWYNSIESLIDHKERNRVAKNAHKQYRKLYDPIYWAKDLHKKMFGDVFGELGGAAEFAAGAAGDVVDFFKQFEE